MHPEVAVNKQEAHWNDGQGAARSFKAVMAWWQEMAQQNNKFTSKEATSSPKWSFISRRSTDAQKENAAKVIQSHFRQSVQRHKYLRIKNAVCILQAAVQAWLMVKKEPSIQLFGSETYLSPLKHGTRKHSEKFGKHVAVFVYRHAFLKLKKSVLIIQRATRDWISRKRDTGNTFPQNLSSPILEKCIHGWIARSSPVNMDPSPGVPKQCEENNNHINAALPIQHEECTYSSPLHGRCIAATKIQCCYRGWLTRKNFVEQKQAATKIQSIFQSARCLRDFHSYKQDTLSAITIQAYVRKQISQSEAYRRKSQIVMIQSHCRGWLTRKHVLIRKEAVIRIQSAVRSMKYRRVFLHRRHATLELQRFARGWLARKQLLIEKEAVIRIQSAVRSMKYRKAFLHQRHATLEIQRFARGAITRKRLLGASCYSNISKLGYQTLELKILLQAVLKLQRWWRAKLLHKQRTKATIVIQSHVRGWIAGKKASRNRQKILAALKLQRWWRGKLLHKERTKAVVVIQSHVRGWIARERASRNKHRIVVIQAYMKGYIARKYLEGQLLDLRQRVQKSAANVDDGMRIINRLVAALSELLIMRSVSSILHVCATLNMATQHSQKCCEELAAAGAVDTLLKLIRSVSRSIPDQEVVKHALCTLRNLSRYPHLIDALIENSGSVEIILWEFLRNKEEGYFITCDLLKKIFKEKKGIEAVHKLPFLVKRLQNHVEELSRKAKADKRTTQPHAMKELVDKRLREAVEILEMIKVSIGYPTRRLSCKV